MTLSAEDSTAIQALLELGRMVIPNLEAVRRTGSRSVNQTGGVVIEEIDLAVAAQCPPPPGEQRNDRGNFGIYYSPRGSAAGGLLRLNVGGEIRDFGPGDWIKGPIEWFGVGRHANSCTVGKARLILITSPWADFGSTASNPPIGAPTNLLGVAAVGGTAAAFIAVNKDTDPSGVMPQGAFDISGWKKIRVTINTFSAAANATSFDLVPWFDPNNDGTWYEQGVERVSVPDTDTSGGQFRVLVFSVSGRGRMFFSIRNLLAAGRASLAFIVEGIE